MEFDQLLLLFVPFVFIHISMGDDAKSTIHSAPGHVNTRSTVMSNGHSNGHTNTTILRGKHRN